MPAKLILLKNNLAGLYKAHKVPLICSNCKKELSIGSLVVRKIKRKHRSKLYCIKCAIEKNIIEEDMLQKSERCLLANLRANAYPLHTTAFKES